jgi:hypothetical protein
MQPNINPGYEPQPFISNPNIIPANDDTFTIKWGMVPIPGAPEDPFDPIDPAVEVRARRNAKKLDVKLTFFGSRKRRSDGRRGFRIVGEDIDVHIWLNLGDDWDAVLRAYAL